MFRLFFFMLIAANLSSALMLEPLLDKTLGDGKHYKLATFSPDGNLIAATSYNNIFIFSSDCKLLTVINGHISDIHSMQFSPDSKKILTYSYYGSIKTWDIFTGEILCENPTYGFKIVFNYDETKMIVKLPNTTDVLDINSGKLLHTFSDYYQKAIFSPDGKYLAMADRHTIKFYDTDSYNEIGNINIDNAEISHVSFSYLSDRIVTSLSVLGEVWVWSITNLSEPIYKLQNDWPKGLIVGPSSFSRDDRYILSIVSDVSLVWDANSGRQLYTISEGGDITHAEISPEGDKVLVSYRDGCLSVFLLPPMELVEKPLSLKMTIYLKFINDYLNQSSLYLKIINFFKKRDRTYENFVNFLTSKYGDNAPICESIIFGTFDPYIQKYIATLFPGRN